MKKYGGRRRAAGVEHQRSLCLAVGQDAGGERPGCARAAPVRALAHGTVLLQRDPDWPALGGLVQANADHDRSAPDPMKLESVVYAISGALFGLIVGWIIGSSRPKPAPFAGEQQVRGRAGVAPPTRLPRHPGPGARRCWTKPRPARSRPWRTDAKNAVARAQLGDLYYDAGRYPEAIKWYEQSLTINPKDVNASTDLGVSYYYNKDTDRAITSCSNRSSSIRAPQDPAEPRRRASAFGKRDLKGATEVWQKLVEVAPQSPEGQQAKQALDSLSSAHGNVGQ